MLRQIGVEGIVTSLHDVPNGEIWSRQKIRELKDHIAAHGMRWSVVESLPVSESIKYGGPDRDRLIENYKESLRNLAAERCQYCMLQLYACHRLDTYRSGSYQS